MTAVPDNSAERLAGVTLLWLKFSDAYGMVGASGGHSPADIDRHFTDAEIDVLLGEGTYTQLLLAHKSRNDDAMDRIMQDHGWEPDDALFRSNGDVHAHAYRRVA